MYCKNQKFKRFFHKIKIKHYIRNYINNILKETFEEYGFNSIETPILCYYNILADRSRKKAIIIHGVQGIILCLTYVLTMIIILSKQRETGNNKSNNIKEVIIANIIAYLSSTTVHAVSNVLIVLTQTF